jgi:GntR family transcriptional regulator, transcriptional repressor for pyruvate dehydrogenase complex
LTAADDPHYLNVGERPPGSAAGEATLSETVKPGRLADAIAERIQALILEGVLRPGERLIAERELAARLGVSRPSLRAGLAQLEAKGLVIVGKSGTMVAPYLAKLAEPLAELFRDDERVAADYFEFRAVVEADAARSAARRATEADRQILRGCLEDMRRAHEAGDPSSEGEADVALHVAIYEAAHNVVVLHVMRTLADLLRQGVFFNRESLYRRPGVREALLEQHLSIGSAVLAGDPQAAEAAAAGHIAFVRATHGEIRGDEMRQAASLRRIARQDIVAA